MNDNLIGQRQIWTESVIIDQQVAHHFNTTEHFGTLLDLLLFIIVMIPTELLYMGYLPIVMLKGYYILCIPLMFIFHHCFFFPFSVYEPDNTTYYLITTPAPLTTNTPIPTAAVIKDSTSKYMILYVVIPVAFFLILACIIVLCINKKYVLFYYCFYILLYIINLFDRVNDYHLNDSMKKNIEFIGVYFTFITLHQPKRCFKMNCRIEKKFITFIGTRKWEKTVTM